MRFDSLNTKEKTWFFHSINELKEHPQKNRKFIHGGLFNRRYFLHFRNDLTFSLEISLPTPSCRISFEADSDNSKLSFNLAVPLLFSVHCGISGFKLHKFIEKFIPKKADPRSPHACGISIFSWALWIDPWVPMHSWQRNYPWYAKTKTIHFKDLILGKMKCNHETIGSPVKVNIPLPEGIYPGTCTFEKYTWKRSRLPWNSYYKESTKFDADKSIPYPGKGENSWDCGISGLCSTSSISHDIPKCIGHVVTTILESRQKYGGSFTWIPTKEDQPHSQEGCRSDVHLLPNSSNYKTKE